MSLICASCGQANRDAARFCAACGSALAVACPSCGAELPEGARFCDACGAAISSVDAAAGEVRKVVTIVFADLAGSTALQEALEAESVRRVMARFYEAMRIAAEDHGGQVEKLVGDGMVLSFGARELHEDDALRAVRGAAAMQDALALLNQELDRVWGVRLRMRTGVNTGELVVSADGELVGDTMNTAARLEQAAGEGEVLVGEATWRLVHHAVELEAGAALELKGKSGPVRAWRLVSVTAPEIAGGGSALEAPLIGREAELERLGSAFEEVLAARECRLVTVMGSPGVGKTRLASELAGAVADSASVVVGRCEPTGEGLTFLPLAEVLRVVADIGEADPAEIVRAKLATLMPEDDPDRARLIEGVAGVLGVAEPSSAQETFWALRRGLEFLARQRPLVLVLDDLHWGQPMLLDLVEHLVEWVRDAPVLMIALARPELRDVRAALAFAGRRARDVIELAPLDEGQSRDLVSGLLGDVRVPATLSARILQTTEGNPLFLGETVRMLVDDGVLRREAGGWVAAGEVAMVEVPPTIHALLAARIERLRADERAVVERAAVIGKQFYRGAVAELVAPLVRIGIDGHLEALRRKDMVEPEGTYWIDEPVFRFHHVLIRDAAYRSLLKEARAELHERFADWLEVKAGELVGEHEEVIAFHLEQAYEYRRELGPLDERGRALGERAAERLHTVGRRALTREDLAAAANLLARALACHAAGEQEILWDLCEAVLSAGDTGAGAGLVERFTTGEDPDPHQRARATVLEGQLANLTGASDIAATAERVAAAAAELGTLDDPKGQAKGWQVAAGAYVRLGQVALVEEALDRALAAARVAGDSRRTTAVLAAAPRAALWGPSPVVRASGRCLDVVRILRMTPGNRHVEAVALRCQAVLEAMRGRAGAAREILAAGRATLQELGLSLELNETAMHAGIVELLNGVPAAAVEHLRAAREGFEALGVAAGAAQAAALLARALVEQGDDDAEALEQTRVAEQHGGEDLKTTITWCSARAEALASCGDHQQALDFARRAVALAEPTDALADKADASIALARVLRAAGRGDEAREAAGAAAGWYEAKGHSVGAERAWRLAGAQPMSQGSVPAALDAEPLGNSRSERFLAGYKQRFDAHDVDGLLEMYAEDWVLVDHRKVGWEDTRGRDPAAVRSVFEASPDVRLDIDRVLACDDHVLAGRLTHRGTAAESGGQYELTFGIVIVVEGGRWQSSDIYDPDDDGAMLARYAELAGRAPDRFRAEFKRRFDAHDLDGVLELFAEDYVQVDHRQIGWEQVRGRDAAEQGLRSAFASSSDVTVEWAEVLACDERVMAMRATWSGTANEGGGAFELPFGVVTVVEEGRRVSDDFYAAEDRQAMIARYAGLGGGQGPLGESPPERFFAEFCRRWAAHDPEPIVGLYAEDWIGVEHRALGWEEMRGRDQARALVRSVLDDFDAFWLEVEEVLACDSRVIAVLATARGFSNHGGGGGELGYGYVIVVDGGVMVRLERYAPHDREAMLARFAELGARAPERFLTEYLRRWPTRDVECLLELYAEDWYQIDHRKVGWEPARGRDTARELLRSAFAASPDLQLVVYEVMACDERVIAWSGAWRGTSPEGGGELEVPFGMVSVVESGLWQGVDMYEPDHRQAMIVRYVELGGGQGRLGDRPPERYWAELLRRFAAHDVEAVVELHAPDWVFVDYRSLAWEEMRGRQGAETFFRSAFAVSPDVRGEVDEVLACDERVIALITTWRGLGGDASGSFEIRVGMVDVIEAAQSVSRDQYECSDRDAMLARYKELCRDSGAEAPVPRPWEHFDQLFNERRLDEIPDLYTDDFVMVDHRSMAWEETRGGQALLDVCRSTLAVGTDQRSRCVLLLDGGGDLALIRNTFSGETFEGGPGGAWEIVLDEVFVLRQGLVARIEVFETGDEAAPARYEQLRSQARRWPEPAEEVLVRDRRGFPAADARGVEGYRALVGSGEVSLVTEDGDLLLGRVEQDPPLIVVARSGGGQLVEAIMLRDEARTREWMTALKLARAYETAGDNLKALMATHHAESRMIDHRPLQLHESINATGIREFYTESGKLLETPHATVEVLEVHVGAEAIAMTWNGTDRLTGGPAEWRTYQACRLRNGLVEQIHIFSEPGEALLKAEELSPQGEHVRIARLYIEAVNARDWDALAQLYTDDCLFLEHRPAGWENFQGVGDLISMFKSMLDLVADAATVRGELHHVDGDGVFLRQIHTGTWQGAPWEIALDTLIQLRDGRLARVEMFNPDQSELLHERLAALGPQRPREVDDWRAPFADDVSLIDLRRGGSATLHGTEAVTAQLGESLSGQLLAQEQEATLVRRADGTVALTFASRAGELAYVEIYGDEHPARERFALIAEDLEALLSVRLGIAWVQALNRRDLPAARNCLADDMVIVDHRPASPFPSEMHGGDAYFARIQSLIELSTDVRWWSGAGFVPAGALSISAIMITGHWILGGGWAEILLGVVNSRREDRFDRFEFFPADARDEQQARLAELAAQRGHGD